MCEISLEGKTALVTGAGRNIGRAIAIEFAAHGANVVINVKQNLAEAETVAAEVERHGVESLIVTGDVSIPGTIDRLRTEVTRRFARLDIYVCNAARRLYKTFDETTNEDWTYYLNQQLSSAWYLAKAFAPAMREAGWGRIVHINGTDGWSGGATRIPHSTAKGGLRTLTKSLAQALGPFGVTANEVVPGYINTVRDLTTHPLEADAARRERMIAETPIRRQPSAEEVAWACLFLVSQRSGAVTGAAIHVDGGSLMLG